MKKTLNIATVFSGIGAPEQALFKMGIKYKIIFACDNGEIEIPYSINEINSLFEKSGQKDINAFVKTLYASTNKQNQMKTSYFANYEIDDDRWYEDIRFLDGEKFNKKVDIFIGGSPCQSFSLIGKRAGLDDTRGTLFYDFARLVKQIQPKVFIYENVPGMLAHDGGRTWSVIKSVFDSLGYTYYYRVLNSVDYGIPQERQRLFVVGFRKKVNFQFPEKVELTTTASNYLEKNINVDPKHYLGKKGFEFVTNPAYKSRARVNADIIRTQKANQQFNWNGDFVFVPLDEIKTNKQIMERAYCSNWNGKMGVVRQMTYRECLRLMGFSDSFKVVVPNVAAYRQIGNSIVVNVLENIFKEIFKVLDFDEKN